MMEPQFLVIYRDYNHWWQRLWGQLRGTTVLWAGNVLPPEAVSYDQDSIRIVWDASGRFWVVAPDEMLKAP